MAEPERTTSFAKSVDGLHKEESALDRARSLRDQFTHAQEQNNEKQKPREAEKPQDESQKGDTEKSGSQMVSTDAPVLRPTPNGPMRQMADRQASAAKLSKERSDSAQKLQQAQQMRDAFKERQQKSPDRGHDRDR
jgi:hypothetical protein